MRILKYLVFGFVCLVLLALAWVLADVVLVAFGLGGTVGMIVSWLIAAIVGGVLIVKVGLRFR